MNKEINTKNEDFILILNLYNNSRYSLLEEKSNELIRSYPKDHKIWNLYCISLIRQDKYKESISSFLEAIKRCPKKALLLNSLGLTYLQKEKIEEAVQCFEDAADFNPQYYPSYINLGNALRRIKDNNQAIRSFKKAIEIDAEDTRGYIYLSLLYKNLGQIEESITLCKKVISLNKGHGLAHRHLSSLITYDTPSDEHILLMKEIIDKDNLKDNDLSDIYFGLGKALEDIGDYEEAFKYLNLGNSICRNNLSFSIDLSKDYFKSLKIDYKRLDPLDIRTDKNNIFVLGMPRSGTSLVEQILSSHSKVVGGGELQFFLKSVKKSFKEIGGLTFPNHIEDIDSNILKLINEHYSASISDLFEGHSHLVDKMPYNFMYIGLILLSLPGSKVVLCERNPIENCFSIYKQKFSKGNNYAYSLNEIAQYYLLYNDLMAFWKELYPDRIFCLSYENLIINQENTSKDLINFCNLNWEESCLFFYENNREVKTASAIQVKKPIYTDSLELSSNYTKHLKILNETLKGLES